MIVSFDFDRTLSRKDVQSYCKELLDRNIDVWIVTSRYDDLHLHRYGKNYNNNDLYQVAEELGIPRWKIRFTCMENKVNYLNHTNVIWHLDDDFHELRLIQQHSKVVAISSLAGSWKTKCDRILKNYQIPINN